MPDDRPSILFIMADDHAAHAISGYGSTFCRTPNLDRLAASGTRFTRCFDVNSLCAPSRASILTGKHSCANGFYRNGDRFDGSQQTFPKLLRAAGYQTAIIGKWHLVSEPTGFDYYNVLPGHGRYWDSPMKETGKPWEDGSSGGIPQPGYLTDVITDRSIRWMEERDRGRPFCLMVHHKAPHTPQHYPDRFARMHAEGDLPEPPTLDDDYAGRPALQACRTPHSRLDMATPEICAAWGWQETDGPTRSSGVDLRRWVYQRFFKGYLRLVASLDENVGRILEYLETSGLAASTVVLYTSDNGYFLGDHGLNNKSWMYEESLRIPLLVRDPRTAAAGSVSDDLVTTLDFAPTFLEYAECEAPGDLHGMSLRPIIEGRRPAKWRESFYYHYYGLRYGVGPHVGVRTETSKLIHFPEHPPTGSREYFDLVRDPREMCNVYDDPEYSGEVRELTRLLEEHQERLGDTAGGS